MWPSVTAPAGAELLAHQLTEPYELPISPVVAAWLVAGVVLAVLFAWPAPKQPKSPRRTGPVASWAGALSTTQVVSRSAAVCVLALAIGAGRAGTDDELENLAPALVVGAAWPLLVVASIAVGAVWRWLDPWDAVARVVTRGQRDEDPGHVWPACAVAVVWVWYLSAYFEPLSPRSIGLLLALYTVFTVAGCLALGRRRWLGTGEPFGIILSWMALLPRRRLAAWDPPPGAEVLLGVLGGGLLFGVVRRSELWGDLNVHPDAELLAAMGLLCFCAAAAVVLLAAARLAARRERSAVARAAVPAVAGIILAVAMERNRLTTSVQLLPGLFGDPFGEGWDLLGSPTDGLHAAPLGTRGLIVAQLAFVLVGHLVGAAVVAHRVRRRAREPVAAALAVLASASVIALASH